MSSHILLQRIDQRDVNVAVIGLGYVGLSLATTVAQAGFCVTGIDVDLDKIEQVQNGHSYIRDVPDALIQLLSGQGKICFTSSFETLASCDVISICVPTPLTQTGDPDLSFLLAAVKHICTYLHRDQLILLESTTYPGTTEDLLVPLFQSTGLKVGQDFFLAFSPERIDPGNRHFSYTTIPKVVGGMTSFCTEIAQAYYHTFVDQIVPVSSPGVAEMTKLWENTFRAVNIALANELMIICRTLKISVWDVIDAAETKPFGFLPFRPGPGVGGHCIPVDPQYLLWKLHTLNSTSRFIELATEMNKGMPLYVVNMVVETLQQQKRCIDGATILVLGVAYKRDVNDVRESPALAIFPLLLQKHIRVVYNDEYVPLLSLSEQPVLRSQSMSEDLLHHVDCVLWLTDHSYYDPAWIIKNARNIVGTRNGTNGFTDPKIVKL